MTDDRGVSRSYSTNVTAGGNQSPTASFTATVNGTAVTLDAGASTDPDGRILSYQWDFGDGGTGYGPTAGHTYATGGAHPVVLTVKDNSGAIATVAKMVQTNERPTAAFTASRDGLVLTVDGSTSSDADGTVAGWAWDFGDGSTGKGSTTSHTYAQAGSYPVTLTVTDDRGTTNSIKVFQTVANLAPDRGDRLLGTGMCRSPRRIFGDRRRRFGDELAVGLRRRGHRRRADGRPQFHRPGIVDGQPDRHRQCRRHRHRPDPGQLLKLLA